MISSAVLTIGGLSVAFTFEAGAQTLTDWDDAHRPFVTPCPTGQEQASLRVWPGAAADADFPELLADGRLWTLRRDPAIDRRRISILGCPVGPLSMTLDLAPASANTPLSGTLYLGPPPDDDHSVPLGYPLIPLLWTLLLGRLPEAAAGLLCHACGVVTPAGDGLLFSGFSGAGKSTTSRLWRSVCPSAVLLSDDRLVLRRDLASPSGFTVYGTPWHGDAEEISTAHAPLRRLLILGRSPDGATNHLTPLSPATASAQLLARTTPLIWDSAGTSAALALAADVCQSLPIARWDFAPTPQAVFDFLIDIDSDRMVD